MGNVPGFSQDFIIGNVSGASATSGEATIWDFHPNSIQFLSAGTELFVSSSSTSDTACFALVCGLDENYVEKSTTTTLNGQTQVSIGTYIRVQSATILNKTAVGDVYIAESDTLSGGVPDTAAKVQSKVPAGDNITHNAWYTVPAGKSAMTVAIRGTTNSANKVARAQTIITPLGVPPLRTVFYHITPDFAGFLFPPRS
jgi:hypothetical protein